MWQSFPIFLLLLQLSWCVQNKCWIKMSLPTSLKCLPDKTQLSSTIYKSSQTCPLTLPLPTPVSTTRLTKEEACSVADSPPAFHPSPLMGLTSALQKHSPFSLCSRELFLLKFIPSTLGLTENPEEEKCSGHTKSSLLCFLLWSEPPPIMSKGKKRNAKDRMLYTRAKSCVPNPAQAMTGPGGSCPSPEAPWPSPTESGYCQGLHCPSLRATSSSQNKPIFLDPSHVAK